MLIFERSGKNMCEVVDRLEKIGRIKGENKLGELIINLMNAGRNEDALIAASDEEAREKFYKEFGIVDK